MSRLSCGIARVGGIGNLRPAPGTWGSAAAIPLGYMLHATLGFPGFAAVTLIVGLIGWWAVFVEVAADPTSDPSEIVIDEVIGQWIALLPASYGFWSNGLDPWNFPYPGWVTAFLAFRLFDIWKPGPVGWADRKHGATGIMLDDVIAGILAGLVVMLGAGLYHGILAR